MVKKLQLDSTRVLLISIVLLIIAGGSIIYYNNQTIKKLETNFDTKLLTLNRDILGNLNELRNDLEDEIFVMGNNLSLQLNIVDNNLKNFRKDNEKQIDALNELINEIEKQSNIQLEALKEDLASIEVKSADFSAIIDDVIISVVSIGTNKGLGSGAIIDDRGFIVTNYHVIEGASTIRVLTYDNKVYDAQAIGFEPNIDIAVIKVSGDNFKQLKFDDSDNVKVGEKVIALGNPAGLSFSVTEGIVSAVHRPGPNNLNIYIQTDVPINPGNSGGPLVNSRGRIIGINNFKIGGFESLGFAIESNTVEDVTDEIIRQYLEQ